MQDETQNLGGDGQEPNNVPNPGAATAQEGSSGWSTDETEMAPDPVEQAGADTEDDDIETPEDPVRQAGAATAQEGNSFLEGEDEAGLAAADVEHIEMPDEYVGRDMGAGPPPLTEENPLLQRFVPDPWAEPTVGDSLPDPPGKAGHDVPDRWGEGDGPSPPWWTDEFESHLAGEMEDTAAIGDALQERQAFDALGDAAEDAGEAVADSVEHIPLIGDALGDVGDFVEDVVDHLDQPVVDPGFFVHDSLGEEPKAPSAEQVKFIGDVIHDLQYRDQIEELHKMTQDVYNDYMNQIYQEQMEDALGDAAEDVGEAVADSVEHIPLIGGALGDTLRNAGDVVEDAVDRMNDPDPVDPWKASPEDSFQRDPITGEPVNINLEAFRDTVKDMGEAVLDPVKDLPFVGEDQEAVDDMNNPAVEDVDPWG